MNNDKTEGFDGSLGSGIMFDGIARNYDLLNRIISLGIDQNWRKQTARSLNLQDGEKALDVATGTADLAIQISKTYPENQIEGIDPSKNMLDLGQFKIVKKSLSERISLKLADAVELPFEDNYFGGSTIAFGIRNIKDRKKALKEMARVTKTGGRVSILELAEPETNGPISSMSKLYIHKIVPKIGSWLSGDDEYEYLQNSIAAFPARKDFEEILEESDLKVVETRPLTFGVCTLFICESKS